jgi:hypothetical protein
MTPAARGRHCAACAKVVIDFTRSTDAEILAVLSRSTRVCGRFRPDQLDRPLDQPAAAPSRWRLWLAAATALWLLRTAAPDASRAQRPWAAQALRPLGSRLQPPSGACGEVSGQVISALTNQPLAGATVQLAGSPFHATTDAEGCFSLPLPAAAPVAAGVVTVTHAAHLPLRVPLPLRNPRLVLVGAYAEAALQGRVGGAVLVGQSFTAPKPPYSPLLQLEDLLR